MKRFFLFHERKNFMLACLFSYLLKKSIMILPHFIIRNDSYGARNNVFKRLSRRQTSLEHFYYLISVKRLKRFIKHDRLMERRACGW